MFGKATLLIAAITLVASATDNEAAKRDMKHLEGKWQIVSIDYDGKPLKLTSHDFVMFAADAIVEMDNKTSELKDVLQYKLDSTKKPKHIDWTGVSGEHKGQKVVGIYKIEGDTLKICLVNSPKSDNERPKGFESNSGTRQRLIVLKRVNSK